MNRKKTVRSAKKSSVRGRRTLRGRTTRTRRTTMRRAKRSTRKSASPRSVNVGRNSGSSSYMGQEPYPDMRSSERTESTPRKHRGLGSRIKHLFD